MENILVGCFSATSMVAIIHLFCPPFRVDGWQFSAAGYCLSSESSSSIVCVAPIRGKVTCSRCG